MFLASSIVTGLIWILFHVRVCGKFVVYKHFRFQATIRHFWCIFHPDKRQCSVQSSRVAWYRKHRYIRWICVAVMCTSGDYVISYLLPVPGRHLWLLTHPDQRQCLDQSSCVARYRKHMGIAIGILLLSYVQAEIYVISYLLPVPDRHLRLFTYPDVVLY